MTVKTVNYATLVIALLVGAALVIAAVLLDITPGIVLAVQPDVHLGLREYCVCERWEPLVTSVEPGRLRMMDVKL